MNIYDFAMQMEKDGENYYRQLAAASKIAGLEKIFGMLADEEVEHFRVLKQMQQENSQAQLAESHILADVKNIFVDMKEKPGDLHVDTTADTEAFRKARDIEQKSIDFYLEKAEEAENQAVKNLFIRLARMEERHRNIMQNLVDFVSRPEPGHWLENAEWHHLEEY
ncbi:MAG: ferritin family protein [Desulfobulbaceae bacterium]|nr:MAG: ferritin family protein [Desulfobulbaceae bacterium]